MPDIVTYAVGEPMPYPGPPAIPADSPIIRTNTDFLDIIFYSAQAAADQKMWQTEQAQLGLFHQDGVPYLLVHFPNHRVTLDCPYNFWRVQANIQELWLTSGKKILGLVLASHSTNLFYAMQRQSVSWADELRRVCELTRQRFRSANEVDQRGRLIESRMNPAQMWHQRYTSI